MLVWTLRMLLLEAGDAFGDVGRYRWRGVGDASVGVVARFSCANRKSFVGLSCIFSS